MKTYIFGAGYRGKKALHYLGIKNVDGFIDNDEKIQGNRIDGILVLSLDGFKALDQKTGYKIWIACQRYWEIEEQLMQNGISQYSIWNDPENSDEMSKVMLDKVKRDISDRFYSYKPPKGMPKNLILAGINLDDANYGCRATSSALMRILQDEFQISDVLYRYELLNMFDDVNISTKDILDYLSYEKINKKAEWHILGERVKKCDALVINGEGSFIFRKNIRKDLFVFCALMMIAIENGVPFYVVNFMLSGEREEGFFGDYYVKIMELLSKAGGIALRDPVSYKIANQYIKDTRIEFIPDALFSDYYIRSDSQTEELMLKNYSCLMPYVPRMQPVQNIKKRYVVVTGSSEAAADWQRARQEYAKLISFLKAELENDDIQLVVMECCRGDSFLRDTVVEKKLVFVPLETNLKIVSVILQKALCFVTGRYHPAIIASLGGTPCVFLKSNSHKTDSLQKTLEYKKIKTYSAIPVDEEIKKIAENVKTIIKRNDICELRKEIISICGKNAARSKELAKFIKLG